MLVQVCKHFAISLYTDFCTLCRFFLKNFSNNNFYKLNLQKPTLKYIFFISLSVSTTDSLVQKSKYAIIINQKKRIYKNYKYQVQTKVFLLVLSIHKRLKRVQKCT